MFSSINSIASTTITTCKSNTTSSFKPNHFSSTRSLNSSSSLAFTIKNSQTLFLNKSNQDLSISSTSYLSNQDNNNIKQKALSASSSYSSLLIQQQPTGRIIKSTINDLNLQYDKNSNSVNNDNNVQKQIMLSPLKSKSIEIISSKSSNKQQQNKIFSTTNNDKVVIMKTKVKHEAVNNGNKNKLDKNRHNNNLKISSSSQSSSPTHSALNSPNNDVSSSSSCPSSSSSSASSCSAITNASINEKKQSLKFNEAVTIENDNQILCTKKINYNEESEFCNKDIKILNSSTPFTQQNNFNKGNDNIFDESTKSLSLSKPNIENAVRISPILNKSNSDKEETIKTNTSSPSTSSFSSLSPKSQQNLKFIELKTYKKHKEESIFQENIDSFNLIEVIRAENLFTPDSLESSISNSVNDNLSSSDEFLSNSGSENTNVEKKSQNQQRQSIKLSESNCLYPSNKLKTTSSFNSASTSIATKFDDKICGIKSSSSLTQVDFLDAADREICQINSKSTTTKSTSSLNQQQDTCLILEKIKKINQLQQRINDINNKIKVIDMTKTISKPDKNNTKISNINIENMNDEKINNQIDTSFRCELSSLDDEITENKLENLKNVINFNANLSKTKDDTRKREHKENVEDIRCYINPNYCEDDEECTTIPSELKNQSNHIEKNQHEDFEEQLIVTNKNNIDQAFRSRNNQTRLGIRRDQILPSNNSDYLYESDDSDDLENEKIDFENDKVNFKKFYDTNTLNNQQQTEYYSKSFNSRINSFKSNNENVCPINNDEYIGYENGNLFESIECDDDDEDEDDEELFASDNFFNGVNFFKKAQPVHKKFASTGFLFHRFGGYLAPIEESLLEDMSSSQSLSTTSSNNESFLGIKKNENNQLINRNSSNCNNHNTSILNNENMKFSLKASKAIILNTSNITKLNDNGIQNQQATQIEMKKIPEDNVERLRNIRDMFENSEQTNSIEQQLQKIEKLQPSEKLKERLTKFEEGNVQQETEEFEDESENNENVEGVVKSTPKSIKKKDIIAFAEMNNVKTKFERISQNDDGSEKISEPKPIRSITPPREGANRVEIENEPMQRPANIVSVFEKLEETLPEEGYIRSRKELFDSAGNDSNTSSLSSGTEKPRVKSITPPREDIIKRVLKEKTPERNENVIRESDKKEEALPQSGQIKQTAALFSTRQKSIERSGITIEGELAEKGIAKSRLALFNDPNALQQNSIATTAELEADIIKNASGIAKERLNLFKNLEQQPQRTSPSRELKKLKEFTPPPQLDHLQLKSNSINKETFRDNENVVNQEFLPESGIAKQRMKQYLENQQPQQQQQQSETEELPEKGIAKSLLAKWKSMENVKEKETSPEHPNSSHQTSRVKSSRAISKERQSSNEIADSCINTTSDDCLPQSGIAKSLLNKWQNIDSNSSSSSRERKGPRPITPPPFDESDRNKNESEDKSLSETSQSKTNHDEELAMLKGHAKNTLAKFEQSLIESVNQVRKSITPPKDYIKLAGSNTVKTVFESQPVESNINAEFAEADVIPAAGHANKLKSKFINFEKEASKVETSSSKITYVPKKFTSSTVNNSQLSKSNGTENVMKNGNKSTNAINNSNTQINNGLLTTTQQNSNIEKCVACEKTVYAMEKIEADKKVYHKLCFKCTSCNCTLKLGNFSSIKQTLYCTPHYIQLFSRNGNYDEGFGLENYKRKWLQRSPDASLSATTSAN